jgi:hypothetical protein
MLNNTGWEVGRPVELQFPDKPHETTDGNAVPVSRLHDGVQKTAAQFGSYLSFREQKRIFCHQIERDETGGECEMCGEKRNT